MAHPETHAKPRTQAEENAEKARTGKSPDAVGGLQNDANPEARNPNPTAIPREGTEPLEGSLPHHGGAFAKVGGAYSGGCVQEEAPPPPEGEALSAAKADTHAKKG